ncbi:MAG: phosphatidylglycerol lysyltransferase domain-containing protein [Negativicutes bacterium]|nr:phosphatidylglycerol lysyltransferase domain-containing protein [Negativicutes bacterium]
MLTWKQPRPEDKALFDSFLSRTVRDSYETSFATLYLWRKYTHLEYAIDQDLLILYHHKQDFGSYYHPPYGYQKADLPEITRKLQAERPTDFLYGEVDEHFAFELKEMMGDSIELIADRDDFEYVYLVEDLINLSGRRYHGQKNHCNTFVKRYQPTSTSISTPQVHADCYHLLQRWKEAKGLADSELIAERCAIDEAMVLQEQLQLKSIAVYAEDRVVGFAIGEKLTEEMAVIHFEKADPTCRGAYAYLNQYFLATNFQQQRFVNRQEDVGDAGLRKVKTEYHPIKMVKKYYIRKVN